MSERTDVPVTSERPSRRAGRHTLEGRPSSGLPLNNDRADHGFCTKGPRHLQPPDRHTVPCTGKIDMSLPLLAKKIVCITGASRGIGRACAVECAKHGATGLILHYYGDEATTKEVQTLKEEIESLHTHSKVVAVPGDIAQRETSQKVEALRQ